MSDVFKVAVVQVYIGADGAIIGKHYY